MSWSEDVLRGLKDSPYYQRRRRHDQELDEIMKQYDGAGPGPEKPNKYNAKATYVDGMRFDSKAEAERWQYLRLRERAGDIADLKRQKKIAFESGVTWRLDFVYRERDVTVFEDVKGKITQDYRIKRDTLIWELETGRRDGIYREVRKSRKEWKIAEYGGERGNAK